jgi:hypothetical protein
MSRGKCDLLNLSKVVLWVSIQIEFTYRDQRVVGVRDDLSHVKDVELVGFSSFFGN